MHSAPQRRPDPQQVNALAPLRPPTATQLLRGRVTFVLYALWFVGCLTLVTALIERAAP